ncbi:DNA-binding transcriptional LysR family regulator [Rhodothalassium salexigens DSM 2132]|uniref:DNA-binding transcriptional LysR family regulator n=1 Tax=Rhodothalassium salexigens DSM 2132 TaxID=1188247 RepID=A0A4R2PQ56_RHOSA|nr:LysR family transcriptional regulator [Rhodothalassium salexigens]MBB4210520.1 DNA-binding transcriptional LysR family regulator [Rhodothalassium salexigens DSM 2132]MBK1638069.1 LysR family transcriptional regulator [Rhodothalassium salexigens DSM 2132]TCP37923.1 DNA-binding transcriptional LysR family regulator [Rhodothalassium salexigens DSM 2132]
MDQLTAIRVFLRVADVAGFTEAARRLGVSKSAVSKQVTALEDHLGVKLVHRTTRQVRLTDEGRAYAERCRRLLDDLDEADAAVRSLRAAPRGRLRVNAALTFGTLHVAPALAAFCRAYPEVVVDLDLSDRFVDIVDEGYDLAIRIGALTDMGMIARQLAPARLAVVAAPDYLDARGMPAGPEALTDHACLLYKGRRGAAEWTLETADDPPRRSVVRVAGPLVANNGDVIRCAARDGLGLALMPTFAIADDLAAGRLVPALPGWAPPPAVVQAVYPPTRHLSAKVRAFIDFLAVRFGPDPVWDRLARGEEAGAA